MIEVNMPAEQQFLSAYDVKPFVAKPALRASAGGKRLKSICSEGSNLALPDLNKKE